MRAVIQDRQRGVAVGTMAAKFHQALANLALAVASRVGCRHVALVGGCFQNALLTAGVRDRLLPAGYRVHLSHLVPPGDGGLALGQVWLAAQKLQP